MGKVIPLVKRKGKLSAPEALRHIRALAEDSKNILIVDHASKRSKERQISRRQIENCLKKGTITEGPFLNAHGNWQVNLFRHAAGENITCTVALEINERLIVITAFWNEARG